MISKQCPKCSVDLRKKNHKTTGLLLILNGLLISPLLLIISYGTIIPYINFIGSIIAGIVFLFKKDGFFYFCSICKNTYSDSQLR